jgi:hypothetical protein
VAPSGGAVVDLSSHNTSVAQVPASVTVSEGDTSATFTVTTSKVTYPGHSHDHRVIQRQFAAVDADRRATNRAGFPPALQPPDGDRRVSLNRNSDLAGTCTTYDAV